MRSGGGWQAIWYALGKAREVGPVRLWRAMRSKNACKTCAVGMGGQLGGMRDESGRFPEVCKKSLQAMAADMRGRIEPRFFEKYGLSELKALTPRELESAGRLVEPLIAEPGAERYRPLDWDVALDRIARVLRETPPERAFFYSSGRSSNEAGFLMHLFARAYGTNHVNNCSYYCHQASGVGLKDSIGQGTATLELEDLAECDLLFLIGGNPASNHPRLMTQLMRLRRRGGKVVVVNPVREPGLVNFRVPSSLRSLLFGSEIASLYIQPAIGGDIALFAGIAKRLIETGAVDRDYVERHTEGFDELNAYLTRLTLAEIERVSGLSQSEIERAADEYARSERTLFAWTMGITHHEHGVQNVQWIANLALLRGMVGKRGAGLLPIRGHSNVQGLGSVGVTPAIRQEAVERLGELGLRLPEFAGHDTMGAIEAAGRGEMDFGLCLGGNLFGASPDAAFVGEALARLRTLVYVSTSLNTGHARGLGQTTIILPALVRDEEQQSTTQESMFNYVRLSDGGRPRYGGPRSEVEILSEIALRTLGDGGPLDWRSLKDHDEIRKLIGRLVPELAPIGDIGSSKREFHIADRVLREPAFRTASGRAAFRAHPIPPMPDSSDGRLRLMTVRSEGQFNTVVYEEEDIYRGQERRDVILVHPLDLSRLGLRANQRVNVKSDSGSVRGVLVREFDIARGSALMYYPEANALVPRRVDPRSKTPAFKSVQVTIEPALDMAPNAGADVAAKSGGRRGGSRRGKLKAC